MKWGIFLVILISFGDPAYVERAREPEEGCDSFHSDCWQCLQYAGCVFRVPTNYTKEYAYCEAAFPERASGRYGEAVKVWHPHECSGIRDNHEVKTAGEHVPTTTKPIEGQLPETTLIPKVKQAEDILTAEVMKGNSDWIWVWIIFGVVVGAVIAFYCKKLYRGIMAAKTRWQRGKRNVTIKSSEEKGIEMEDRRGRTYTRSVVEEEINRSTPSPLNRQDRKYHTVCSGDRRRGGREWSVDQAETLLRNPNFGQTNDLYERQMQRRRQREEEERIRMYHTEFLGHANAVYNTTTAAMHQVPVNATLAPTMPATATNPVLVPNNPFNVQPNAVPSQSYVGQANNFATVQTPVVIKEAVPILPSMNSVNTGLPIPPSMPILNTNAAKVIESKEKVLVKSKIEIPSTSKGCLKVKQESQGPNYMGELHAHLARMRKSIRDSEVSTDEDQTF